MNEMTSSLQGKVFLVTGATEGIGKAAALEFARQGATLALVGRSREKGEKVVAELKAASGNEHIELLLAELSRQAEIRALAATFRARYERLDVLVNNAGALFTEYQRSADGIELTFAVNHLSYFLLTTLLLDLLQETPGARVVSTSSGAHRAGKLNLEDMAERRKKEAGFAAYGDSKLANILFTRELARRLASSGATANCLHPGFVRTGFALNNQGFIRGAVKVASYLFARKPEKGAETLVWLATNSEAASFNGQYFHDKKVASLSPRAQDDTLARELWELSERLCAPSAKAAA